MTPSPQLPDEFPPSRPSDETDGENARDATVRRFVEHWGVMARSWGINATMGELFALLYVTGSEWTADEMRDWLGVSRGNVSMNLRELMAWGVVHKIHKVGERRDFFRAEADVWILFRHILSERKRRELDPTLQMLAKTVQAAVNVPGSSMIEDRIAALSGFFKLADTFATRILAIDPQQMATISRFIDPEA